MKVSSPTLHFKTLYLDWSVSYFRILLAPFLVAPVVAVTHDDADALGVAEGLLVIPAEAVLVEGRDRRAGGNRVLSEKGSEVKIPDLIIIQSLLLTVTVSGHNKSVTVSNMSM